MKPHGTTLILAALGLAVLGGLTGCAAPAAPRAMVASTVAVSHRHPGTVAIRTQGGNATGTFDVSGISDQDLAQALADSILASGLFEGVAPEAQADYTLYVTQVYQSKPLFGTEFTVEMEAAWALVDNVRHTLLLREAIQSAHTATVADAVIGATRFRLAVEGAARNNIHAGLSAIGRLSLPPPR